VAALFSATFAACSLPPALPSPHGLANVALRKLASQSSTYSLSSVAALAVDGNTFCDTPNEYGVAITRNDAQTEWWLVDLGSTMFVHEALVQGRPFPNGNIGQSMNIVVRLGNSSQNGGASNFLCSGSFNEAPTGPGYTDAGVGACVRTALLRRCPAHLSSSVPLAVP
jgi:hypothetical protein